MEVKPSVFYRMKPTKEVKDTHVPKVLRLWKESTILKGSFTLSNEMGRGERVGGREFLGTRHWNMQQGS
jgi:hypothetical protein